MIDWWERVSWNMRSNSEQNDNYPFIINDCDSMAYGMETTIQKNILFKYSMMKFIPA